MALRLLQDLHRRRNYRPVADTVTRLLKDTRAHVGLILRAAGEQALADTLRRAKERRVTVVVVTQRPTLLTSVDKVLVLKAPKK